MIVKYEKKYEKEWDDFVLKESINGNFLQTRNFYNYHPSDKFKDASIILKKNERIAAVVPANITKEGKSFLSHQGSTFGGLIVGKDFSNSRCYDWIFDEMLSYFNENKYERIELRMHSWLYSPDLKHHELLDYYFQLYGFSVRSEIGFYIDLKTVNENFECSFENLKKRKLKKANRNGLSFKKLSDDDEIIDFYNVLCDNMKKFDTVPLHSLNELLDFKNKRLISETSFYGVFFDNKMIAGSMVWNFCNKKVFHTQYLASLHDYLEMCPNEFLYANLIKAAKNEGYKYLSYGTACFNHGEVYNKSLGIYKEGFNTDSYMNRCYIRTQKF